MPGASLSTILRSISSDGKSKLMAMKRCLVDGLRSFSTGLVTGVVRDHQHEIFVGLDFLTFLFDRQTAPVIGQRVYDDGRVRAGFDDFVEVAYGADFDCAGERPVLPDGLGAFEQKTSDEIGTRQIFVTRNRHERPAELESHVLEKTGLAAASGPFQHDRKPFLVRGFEYGDLVALRLVIGRHVSRLRRLNDVALDTAYTIYCWLHVPQSLKMRPSRAPTSY